MTSRHPLRPRSLHPWSFGHWSFGRWSFGHPGSPGSGAAPRERERERERGSITPAIMVFAVSALAAAGLAIDGGRKLNGLSEVRDLADNAARVGAQQVDVDAYRATGIPSLDATAASGAAVAYLSATGHTGSVSVNGDTITVTVTLTIDNSLLPGSATVSATESATAEASVTGN